MNDMNNIDMLTTRLERLEGQHRRLKRVTAALVLLAAKRSLGTQRANQVLTSFSEVEGTPGEGQVNVFSKGRLVASIASSRWGGGFITFQFNGKRAAALGALDTGGTLDIADKDGETVGFFDAKSGGGYSSVKNTAHREVGRIYAVDTTRRGVVQLRDDTNTQTFRAP